MGDRLLAEESVQGNEIDVRELLSVAGAAKTHLDLINVRDDSAHPARTRQCSVLVHPHNAAILETSYYDLKTLGNVALDET